MRFDAIVTAGDIIEAAFRALREFTTYAGCDLARSDNRGRAFALTQCWTLVDQLHAIRQLLQTSAPGPLGPLANAFLGAAEVATKLRNDMDHLAKKLDNLSKAKGHKSPLFGSLSYFYAPTPDPARDGGHIVLIMSGALHGSDMMPMVNPGGRSFTLPTGLFTLSAFGCELEFAPAIGALRDWLRHSETNIEADIRKQLAAVGSSPEDTERAMMSLGGGLAVIADFSFHPEPRSS
jgi:hypothetical protein